MSAPVPVGGPWFEDFEHGEVFDESPGMTLTPGHTAVHQAVAGDRLRLALDAELCRAVTGDERLMVHPNLVCDLAIGQSTPPTQSVRGNLFYRGLVLERPVFVGETLRTRTEVVGLKQNRRRPDGSGAGLVALRIRTTDGRGEPLLDFWRCPMIPLRDPGVGHRPRGRLRRHPQGGGPGERGARAAATPGTSSRSAQPRRGPFHDDLTAGTAFAVEAGETVTGATELARLTLNVATAHTDATGSSHGRRLVYGGHTIAVAAAHATRAIPAIATIVAWQGCDHLAPVFEGDVLRTELEVEGVEPRDGGGGLAALRARVAALRARRRRARNRYSTGASWRWSHRRRRDCMAGILDGMRVIEGSAFVAAPLGGMAMAQLGADVIRFDPIGGGLDSGRWPVTRDGRSLFWAGLNKGKRSLQVDLRSDEGRELVSGLITAPGPDAGLFLTNFPARGFLDYDALAARRRTS